MFVIILSNCYRVFHVACFCMCMHIACCSSIITWHVLKFMWLATILAAIGACHMQSSGLGACMLHDSALWGLGMNPDVSTTLLNLLRNVPGANSLPKKFPLFPNSQNPHVLQQQANHTDSSETPRGSCTTKVGTQVNVTTGGSSGAVGNWVWRIPA